MPFFSRSSAFAETRIGRVVAFEQLVLDLGLSKQVPPKIGFADDPAVLVVRIRKLRHGDIRVDPASLHRTAGRRIVAGRCQPQRAFRPRLHDVWTTPCRSSSPMTIARR